jgi:hypothetical protein
LLPCHLPFYLVSVHRRILVGRHLHIVVELAVETGHQSDHCYTTGGRTTTCAPRAVITSGERRATPLCQASRAGLCCWVGTTATAHRGLVACHTPHADRSCGLGYWAGCGPRRRKSFFIPLRLNNSQKFAPSSKIHRKSDKPQKNAK